MSAAPFPWQTGQWHRLINQYHSNRLAHAYLLTGEQGLGKQAFAIAAARLLLCEKPEESQACGACRSCNLFDAGTNPDLFTVEPESSQVIKIDQIRILSSFSNMTSHGNRRKIMILRQADSLNINAANALLKTLEEPPDNTVLFLVTTTPGKLLATIRSRCQRIAFVSPDFKTALDWIKSQSENLTDCEALLEQVNNRPLLALQLLDSGESDERNNLIKALLAIIGGSLDPVEFALHGKTIGPEKVLEQLWRISGNAIKQILVEGTDIPMGQDGRSVLQVLAKSPRSMDELLGRLITINQSVEEARKQLGSGSNPNSQLLLEGLLWRWSRLPN